MAENGKEGEANQSKTSREALNGSTGARNSFRFSLALDVDLKVAADLVSPKVEAE